MRSTRPTVTHRDRRVANPVNVHGHRTRHGREEKHEPAVKRHKIAQRLSSETVAHILAEYQSGISTPVLAKQYDIGTTAVKRLLHTNGVQLRRYHRLSEADVLAAVKLYKAGWSIAEIGRQLDADDETVRRRLRELKVPMRGHIGGGNVMNSSGGV